MKKLFILIVCGLAAIPSLTFAQKTTVTRINREKTYETKEIKVWYQGELNLGFATGGKLKDEDGDKYNTDYSRPFLETVHGVRITRYGFVGVGVGAQYAFGKMYPDEEESDDWNTLMIPVFLNLKGYYPVSEHFAPYISVSLGNSFCATSNCNNSGSDGYSHWEEKLKGGFFGEYGIGFNYKRLNFGLGLQHQTLKYESQYGSRYGSEKETYTEKINSFFVKIGLKF